MSGRRPLSTLGLCSSAMSKLLEADFVYDEDIKDLKPTELSLACGLSAKECAEVIRIATADGKRAQPVTVLQMIEYMQEGDSKSQLIILDSITHDLDTMSKGHLF
ncbi:hypothetical protein SK128_007295 [Halocaridina rubra]|uniref:Uncharacterized protein n=1 Tax=Halocaridina rubra TaxID=373956 RepID=A0AAN8ZYD1_HALRR